MIQVKLVHPNAKLPTRANPDDAGADLYSVEDVVIPPHEKRLVDIGIQIAMTGGEEYVHYYHRIAPRSGLAAKNGIDVFAGVIDKSYRGNVKVILYNSSVYDSFHVKAGDRVAQLITERCVITGFLETDTLPDSSRGSAGFGSTGS